MSASSATDRSGIARASDGCQLPYRLRGAPGATRLVLVHSLGLNQDVWEEAGALLASRAQVLTYDARGHGEATKSPGPYTIGFFADDLAAVLDAVGWSSAIVGGVSMGGNVAQAFASIYQDRTQALALFDTTAWYGPEAPANWESRARQAETQGLASLVDFQVTRWFSDETRRERPELGARCMQIFLSNDVACYAATCRMLGALDLRDRITHIQVPTLIAVGEEDDATPPAMAEGIQAAIAGSTLHVLPKTRHLSPLERPREVSDLVRRVLGPDAR